MRVNIFRSDISEHQARDTGMAMTLIALILGLVLDHAFYFRLALVILIANMIIPVLFKPVARIWLGFSHLLGTVVSRIILSLIFFLVVTPVGVLRRWMGRDSLQLKKFKRGKESVMRMRSDKLSGRDIERPY